MCMCCAVYESWRNWQHASIAFYNWLPSMTPCQNTRPKSLYLYSPRTAHVMRAAKGSVQGTALALVLLGLTSCIASDFFEDFGPGWEKRWIHSGDEKYVGRFVVDTPEGWDGPGLKASSITTLGDRS